MYRRSVVAAFYFSLSSSICVAGPTSELGIQPNWTDRRAAAVEYAELFRNFENAIPDLTPKEQQWVDAERAKYERGEMSSSAGSSFINTREYQLAELHREIQQIRRVISNIQKSQQSQNTKAEYFYWVSLIYKFGQEHSVGQELETLLSDGAIKKSDFPRRLGVNWLMGPADGQVQMTWDWWATSIWDGFLAGDLLHK